MALSADEARAIAKEVYVYGWPMAENYNTLFSYVVNEGGPQYKAPFNSLANLPKVFTPADTAIVTPNSDTPYTMMWLDLRAEPMVLTVPPIDAGRYWSFQMVDVYTFNYGYLGTRATGNGGGSYLLVGPDWQGDAPDTCASVFRCETPFAFLIGRTQLFSPEDLENVKAVQAQYKLEPLSSFRGAAAPPAAPATAWPKALGVEGNRTPQVFEIIDFLLAQLAVPVHSSEEAARDRFRKLGVGSGSFKADALDPALQKALEEGVADAWQQFDAVSDMMSAGKVTSGDFFGTREFLSRDGAPIGLCEARFAGAKIGLYGNSREEAMYPIYKQLDGGEPLDASESSYKLRLAPGDMSMAKAFWSLTMYDGKTQLLVDNPLKRYLLNSPMLGSLKKEEDGSVIIHVSAGSPGADLESNWLPAPSGPFYAVLRLYWPDPATFSGAWTPPVMQRC